MAGSNITTRQSLPRRFENYVLTREVGSGVGLSNIADELFTPVQGVAGQPAADDQMSDPIPLGFEFQFDGIVYKHWAANTNGWMVLVDPTQGTFTLGEVLGSMSWINASIKPTFSSNAVMLCPWFDDLRNVVDAPQGLITTPYLYSLAKISRISQGFEPAPIFINTKARGLSYYHDSRSSMGRRCIIRWTSASNYTSPSSIIRFEVVIYENGTIEFRYTPKESINLVHQPYEGATIGIFMPNGTNRFRDFSAGLGYRENTRKEYMYGGYVYDPTYTDTAPAYSEDAGSSAAYTINLLPQNNWPGLATAGCVLTFAPPRRRRKILPRKLSSARDSRTTFPTVARTGDSRLGRAPSFFDDRKSPNYTMVGAGSTINYPTTLPRFFGGNGSGVKERQDLFTGDFLINGNIVKSAIDQYVNEEPTTYVSPYQDDRRYDQDPTTLGDGFFIAGTNGKNVVDGFDQNLRSKTHVRISLPVNVKITMPGQQSTIYYYNHRSKSWEVPFNSSYIISVRDSSAPPNPNPYAGGDIANAYDSIKNNLIIEDARGFGPIGNLIASGSNPLSAGSQSDVVFGSNYDHNLTGEVISKQYTKSVRNNEEYRATADETFTIPINAPFLIEKAVFEVPLAFGPGWFADKTQCFIPVNSTAFDFAGPALTVALFRQIQLAKNDSGHSIRDLILTGTITHKNDYTSQVVIQNEQPYSGTFQIRPVGFLAYGGPAGAVVNPDPLTSTFTGSVKVQAQALSAAGISVIFRKYFESVERNNVIDFLGSTPTINLSGSSESPRQYASIGYVSPLGRGGTGFEPAGRAILGNEFVALQGLFDPTGKTAANPLYQPNGLSDAQLTTIKHSDYFSAIISAVIPLVTHFPSPYLVMPGDKLILAISKTRPVAYASGSSGSPPFFSGSLSHDVCLIPGNINITLYGSQVQAGVEYHDTLNQELGSNVVHEIIGAESIIDQFEVAYQNEYSGSYSDNMVLGTMTRNDVITRGRRASKLGARNTTQLDTGANDIRINPYKGYRTQPWFEKAGSVRTAQHFDSTERFWDSMMPSISECFKADGTGIFIAARGTFGDFRQVESNVTRLGWIMMDNKNPRLSTTMYNPIINGNWNKSFPFEPRYQNASRQFDISHSFLATYIYQPSISPAVQSIVPTPVNGLICGSVTLGTAVTHNALVTPESIVYTHNSPMYEWFVDSNLSGKVNNNPDYVTSQSPMQMYATSSMPIDDANRFLFGFGDRNTCYQIDNGNGTSTLLGTNHLADHRDVEGPHPDGTVTISDYSNFVYSPVIRGWKYGVYNGNPAYSKAYWRRDRFGQFRDMLEQRPFTKYYQAPESRSSILDRASNNGDVQIPNFRQGVQPAAITVNFIDPASGRSTSPDNTWASNLHFECTSSLPFFDGQILNRPKINPTNLNLHPNLVNHDIFGNIHIA